MEGVEAAIPRFIRPSLGRSSCHMPIHHMLYRCPRCGHDPLEGRKGRAKCSSCGTRFEQGRGSLILMRPPQGPVEEASATSLIADLEKMGGAGTGRERGTGSSGERLLREARVAFGTAGGYDVIRWWGEVIGFSERISWKGKGLIRLEGESLTFTPNGEAAVRGGGVDPDTGGEEFSCLLGDIRGIQISSGAVQVTLERGQLYQFEFVDDSAKRWEDLLCLALRRFYREEGRSVIEFKPRVVTEWLPIGSDR